jgi:hypothetical protein
MRKIIPGSIEGSYCVGPHHGKALLTIDLDGMVAGTISGNLDRLRALATLLGMGEKLKGLRAERLDGSAFCHVYDAEGEHVYCHMVPEWRDKMGRMTKREMKANYIADLIRTRVKGGDA